MKTTRRLQLGVAASAVVVVAVSGSVHAAEPPQTEAQGQSQAVLARLVPYVGIPGVAASVGLVTAQVANSSAQASAAAADFGLLGTLATVSAGGRTPEIPGVPALDLPAPISADSEGTTSVERDPFAQYTGAAPATAADPTAPQGFAAHESANATKNPLGATGVVVGPALKVPGLIDISAGRSAATSTAKNSRSEVTLDQIDLGAGAVVLSGLRWTATQATEAKATAGFSLRGLRVNGQDLPVDSPAELAGSLTQVNAALAPLGLLLDAPTQVADANGATVAPLVIQFRNPESLVEPSRQVSGALAPVVSDLVTQLVAANPDAAAAQIVANAIVGGAGGRSGGRLELGGVSARSGLVLLDEVLDSVAGAAPTGSGPVSDAPAPTTTDSVTRLDTGAGTLPTVELAPTSPGAAGSQPLTQNAAALRAPDDDNRGLAIAALAIGLALVLALALGDRLRMAAIAT